MWGILRSERGDWGVDATEAGQVKDLKTTGVSRRSGRGRVSDLEQGVHVLDGSSKW